MFEFHGHKNFRFPDFNFLTLKKLKLWATIFSETFSINHWKTINSGGN
jgi:hypothetical protein